MQSEIKICPQCQNASPRDAGFCARCGYDYALQQPQAPMPQMMYPTYPVQERKSKVAAALLAFFFGSLGIHGFYLGNNTMGAVFLALSIGAILLLFTIVGILLSIAIWCILPVITTVQAIIYACSSDEDFHQKYVVQQRWF